MRVATHRPSSLAAVLFLSAAFAAPAFAQSDEEPAPSSCTDDTACAEGQHCELMDCGPTCDPDDPSCEPVDCGSGGMCVDDFVPAPECAADADCSDGDVCITRTYESCSSSGCACPDGAPDCDCDAPEEPVCETSTESFCGPRYLAPCAADADCGAGFTCAAADVCTCSSSSAGDAEECSCAESDEKTCVLQNIPCENDDACPAGLTCQEQASAAPCFIAEDGSSDCDAPATDGEKICAPVGYIGGGVLAIAEDADDDGAGDDDGDIHDAHAVTISCAAARSTGMLPLFALLGLLLVRRRAA